MDLRSFELDSPASLSTGWTPSCATTTPQLGASVDHHRVTDLFVSPFRFDVTPPLGHGCCGNWIKPIEGFDDSHEAIGLIIFGAGKPIVLMAVDWTGILNEAHLAWREAIATAAGTTPDRVAVHAVHQHNAPFACLETQRIIAEQGDLPGILNLDFFHRCLDAAHDAVALARNRGERVTEIAFGQARVHQVASNRRILGPDGCVLASRGSSSTNPKLRALPEGLIDPMLKTVAFLAGDRKLAACHFYACHPMSYYGDGRASSDFVGLARKKRQGEEPGCTHLYFNGCGGNISAGKYNDGSVGMRSVLTQRMYEAIVAADATLQRMPIDSVTWTTRGILPPVDPRWDEERILAQISDKKCSIRDRSRPAYAVAWIRRHSSGLPLLLSALHINQVSMVYLPAEVFVEYQLQVQRLQPSRFVAIAAYGDGGPWYIPTAAAYPQRGYEVSVAWCAPEVEAILTAGVRNLFEFDR